MRILAMRSPDPHLTDGQRGVLTAEYKEASIAMDRIAQATVYNNRILLASFHGNRHSRFDGGGRQRRHGHGPDFVVRG